MPLPLALPLSLILTLALALPLTLALALTLTLTPTPTPTPTATATPTLQANSTHLVAEAAEARMASRQNSSSKQDASGEAKLPKKGPKGRAVDKAAPAKDAELVLYEFIAMLASHAGLEPRTNSLEPCRSRPARVTWDRFEPGRPRPQARPCYSRVRALPGAGSHLLLARQPHPRQLRRQGGGRACTWRPLAGAQR